jgi:YceI-like domain
MVGPACKLLQAQFSKTAGHLVFKSLWVGSLALLVAACGAPKPRPAAPQSPAAFVPAPDPPAGRIYRIDEGQSELRILVYRAGPLARLGHNHVIVNRSVHGTVSLGNTEGAPSFSLRVPAAAFLVDDARARAGEGADFNGDVPDDAKSGTLRNMLGTSVLDADEFPEIAVECTAASGMPDLPGSGTPIVSVVVNIAGHESRFDVPVVLTGDARRLSAAGSLELRQSALGLTPYSLMLGALQVQDALTIKFQFVAVAG